MTGNSVASGLEGRVAIVTGGASGIGAGITRVLATAGATVVILDVNAEGAKHEAAAFREAGLNIRAMALDVSDEAAIIATCAEIESTLGAPWVLVNNAGLQDREPFLEGTAEEWERMQSVNARGPFLVTRELARSMVRRGEGGRIVNIASAALRGSLVRGLVAYTASKGALLGLSSATAFELAREG